ncbi:MAG: hypothetical protein JXA18_09430 [Chitinispirillaceae bacterium]|nr:hypothetical protein [Chitinispirillaceae bacterium]
MKTKIRKVCESSHTASSVPSDLDTFTPQGESRRALFQRNAGNRSTMLFIVMVSLLSSAFSQDIFETGTFEQSADTDTASTVLLPSPMEKNSYSRKRAYALPAIRNTNGQTIAGATLFFSGVAFEWMVLAPWSVRFSNHLSRYDTVRTEDSQEALGLLLASLPVGMLQISGASVACAGASRLKGTYTELVDPKIDEIHVWIPYIIGWVGRGFGSTLGFIAGFSNSSELSTVASYLSLASEIAWTTSTIMSLVYSSKWRREAVNRLTIAPGYSPKNGTTLTLDWSF